LGRSRRLREQQGAGSKTTEPEDEGRSTKQHAGRVPSRMPPLVVLVLSMALVIALIVLARAHAFLALLAGALLVGLTASAVPWAETATIVATEFGTVTGRIGIIIALASIVGLAMHRSGGAARISEAFLKVTGERRAYLSLWGSGFVLSVPVFFDTVFYLLAPIARAMHSRTGKQYGLYVSATVAGAGATHVFVPPTPGPLAVGATLGVDLGLLIMIALVVAIPASLAGVAYGLWASRSFTRDVVPVVGPDMLREAEDEAPLRVPALTVALVPIVLPVILIATKTAFTAAKVTGPLVAPVTLLGDPNIALLLSAASSLWMVKRARGWSLRDLGAFSEEALAGAGSIILITAAGGAYGGLLTRAGVGAALAAAASAVSLPVMVLAYGVAALLKVAQGSSTVAMITTASILQAVYATGASDLPHPAYATLAIAGGALVGSWMNDSGFWVIAKMGRMTEADTFKTWTATAAVTGTTGALIALLLSVLVPLR
jgi:gluconate:H+ symporter, GntP family